MRPTVFTYRDFRAALGHAHYLSTLGVKARIALPQPGEDRFRVRFTEEVSS